MEGGDTKSCCCSNDRTPSTTRYSVGTHKEDNSVGWKAALLLTFSISSAMCCVYVLNCLYTTRLEVAALKLDINLLRTQFLDASQIIHSAQSSTSNARTKRSLSRLVGPLLDNFVGPLRGPQGTPRGSLTRHTVSRPRVTLTLPRVTTPTPQSGTRPRFTRPRVTAPITTPTPQRAIRTRHTRPMTTPTLPRSTTTRRPILATSHRTPANATTVPPFFAIRSPNLVVAPEVIVNQSESIRPGGFASRNVKGAAGATDGVSGANGIQGNFVPTGRRQDSSSSAGSGATFIRWGKLTCPQGGSKMVYSGYAGAAHPWYSMGGSTELECLPMFPTWHSNAPTTVQTSTKIFAAKFFLGSHTGIFQQSVDNSVITCVVCLTPKAPVITLPGRRDCPPEWYPEYKGYLMASTAVRYELYFSSRSYCVDWDPDFYRDHNDNKGLKLTFVQAGSCFENKSPCTRYRENYRMACVVCSKIPNQYQF